MKAMTSICDLKISDFTSFFQKKAAACAGDKKTIFLYNISVCLNKTLNHLCNYFIGKYTLYQQTIYKQIALGTNFFKQVLGLNHLQ